MNYDEAIKNATRAAQEALEKVKALQKQHKAARTFTSKFLNECGKSHIERVSISRKHESVPASMTWPFGHQNDVFMFTTKENKARASNNGWPAIWGVVQRTGLKMGCGNTDQAYVENSELLIDGVYHIKNGKWQRVD